MSARQTPETDGVFMAIAVGDFIDHTNDALCMARDHGEKMERQRDELLAALEEMAQPACMAMTAEDRIEGFRDMARAAIANAKGTK